MSSLLWPAPHWCCHFFDCVFLLRVSFKANLLVTVARPQEAGAWNSCFLFFQTPTCSFQKNSFEGLWAGAADASAVAEEEEPMEPVPPVAPAGETPTVELTDTAVVGEEGEEEAPEDDSEVPDVD